MFSDPENPVYDCCSVGSGVRYVENTISWPDGYWHRVSPQCLRLLIWCSVTHDGATYDIAAPTHVYRVAVKDAAEVDAKPNKWLCCPAGGYTYLGGIGTPDADVEAYPTGNLMWSTLDESACEHKPAIDEVHMIWAIVESWHAVSHEIKSHPGYMYPGDRIDHGLAHMVLIAAGFVRNHCGCGEFVCEDV